MRDTSGQERYKTLRLVLQSIVLAVYALIFFAVTHVFVRWYEEPTLRRQFGEQYEAYRRVVPAWWPRRRPWKADNIERS